MMRRLAKFASAVNQYATSVLASTRTQVRVSVGASFLICLLIGGLHFYQRFVFTQQAAQARSFREARLDLLMGFMHVENSEKPGSPFELGQGIALIRQAVESFERSANGSIVPVSEMSKERARVFRIEAARFQDELIRQSDVLDESPQKMVEFRVQFHQLSKMAEEVDNEQQQQILRLLKFDSQVFWCVFFIAVVLLAIVLLFVLLANRAALSSESARHAAESEIRSTAELLQAIINGTPDVIFVKDLEGRYVLVNRAMSEFLGSRVENILGQTDTTLFEADIGGRMRSQDLEIAASGVSKSYETTFMLPGGRKTFSVTKAPFFRPDGAVRGVVGISRDITLDREMTDALAKSEATLMLFVEHAPAAVVMLDEQMRYLVVSRRWKLDFDLTEDSLIGRSHYELFPEVPARWRDIHSRALAGETLRSELDHFVRANGTTQWMRWEVRPWRQFDGQIGGIVIFSEDISDRHRAEEAVRQSEERFRLLFEHMSDGVFLFDTDRRIASVNRSACEMLGYSREELVGQSPYLFDHVISQDEITELNEHISRGNVRSFDTVHTRKDGTTYDAEIRTRSIQIDHRQFALSTARNISERKEAERLLRQQRDRLAILAETSPGVLLSLRRSVDGTWSLAYASRAYQSVFGFTPEQLTSASVQIRSVFSPEDIEMLREKMLYSRQQMVPMLAEHGIVNPIRGKLWVRTHLAPVRESDGATIWHGFVVDITSLKQAESEIRALNIDLENRVRQRTLDLEEANRELEAFSYSVSHDLRAPLRAINGFSQILIREYSDLLPARGQEYLADVAQGARLMGQLVDDLLAFSRLGRKSVHRTVVNMNSLVAQCIEELDKTHPERQIHWNIKDVPDCSADPSLIKQVWQNLLGNAVKYTGRLEQPVIEIGTNALSEGVEYYVRDNGVGFDMKYAGKLFGVFQRLHRQEEFEGTGIGLALVQRILQKHGGSIRAEAIPGQGAAFFFQISGGSDDRHAV